MVETRFKTFWPLAAASSWRAIIVQSALIGAVRLAIARRGAAIRKASSRLWSTCHSFRQAADSAGEWPVITLAPAKAGALTRLILLGANRVRVIHRLLDLALRRDHAPCRPHRQALTQPLRLRHDLVQARDNRSELQESVSVPKAFGIHRTEPRGRERRRRAAR